MSKRFTLAALNEASSLANAVLADGLASNSLTESATALRQSIDKLIVEREQESAVIAAARGRYESDDLEIDDDPIVSIGENGVWVGAWVWVGREADHED